MDAVRAKAKVEKLPLAGVPTECIDADVVDSSGWELVRQVPSVKRSGSAAPVAGSSATAGAVPAAASPASSRLGSSPGGSMVPLSWVTVIPIRC